MLQELRAINQKCIEAGENNRIAQLTIMKECQSTIIGRAINAIITNVHYDYRRYGRQTFTWISFRAKIMRDYTPDPWPATTFPLHQVFYGVVRYLNDIYEEGYK